MIETELGNLRRSHYSDEITPSMDGTQVIIMGWVLTIRGHGNITFATIRDKNGDISLVAKKGDCPDDIREKISSLKAQLEFFDQLQRILIPLLVENRKIANMLKLLLHILEYTVFHLLKSPLLKLIDFFLCCSHLHLLPKIILFHLQLPVFLQLLDC